MGRRMRVYPRIRPSELDAALKAMQVERQPMEATGLMDAAKTRSLVWRVPAWGSRSRFVCFSSVLFALVLSEAARAQLFERALVLQDARLVTMAGEPIEGGTVIVKGGRIAQIGSKVDAPFLSKTINLTGRTITPGFIDAWSALGRLPGFSSADPTSDNHRLHGDSGPSGGG